MAKYRFHLHSKNQERTPILLSISYPGNRLRYFLGLSVLTKNWDQKKQRVKPSTIEGKELNPLLEIYSHRAKEVFHRLIFEGESISNDLLRARLNRALKGIDDGKAVAFFEYVEKHIDELKAQVNLNTGEVISKSTISAHRQALNRFFEFSKDTNFKITFESIDNVFLQEFLSWAYAQRKDDSSPLYGLNTLGKYIKHLKAWLNRATELGINKNLEYRSFKKPREDVEAVYLNSEELERIRNLDLTNHPGLDQIRDAFIIASWCGLRFSDISKLSSENIQGGNIVYRQQKGAKTVVAPILKPVEEILSKRSGIFPRAGSNPHFNREIKRMAEMAEIDETIIIHRIRGGERTEMRIPKYSLITSHTARRSFATNMYNLGMAPRDIMNITGHANEKVFFSYIKTTKEQSVERVKVAMESHFKSN